MATTRIDMRIDEEVKRAAEKAAALQGIKSLTEYVVQLLKKDSERVIREHSKIVVEDDVFDRFMGACKAAEEPNEKLREAFDFYKKQAIR